MPKPNPSHVSGPTLSGPTAKRVLAAVDELAEELEGPYENALMGLIEASERRAEQLRDSVHEHERQRAKARRMAQRDGTGP